MTTPVSEVGQLSADPQVCEQVRRDIVRMCAGPEGGHLGGSMSAVEALVALVFHQIGERDLGGPSHIDRDVLLLSKGHAALALYAVLARRGVLDPAHLDDYARSGSRLSPHPNPKLDGVEAATGSLGHGLGLGAGFAFARQRAGVDTRVYVVLGDGELQEGSCWEAAQVASALRLANLVAVVDANGGQQTGMVSDISPLEPLADKWRSFGWEVTEVPHGNDIVEVREALESLGRTSSDRPHAIVLRTVKGHGVPRLAGKPASHFVALDDRKLAEVERSMASVKPPEGALHGEHA